jgi:hypothetical protein
MEAKYNFLKIRGGTVQLMVFVIKTGGDVPMPHSSEVIFHTHLLGGKQPHELTVLWARHCSFKNACFSWV